MKSVGSKFVIKFKRIRSSGCDLENYPWGLLSNGRPSKEK